MATGDNFITCGNDIDFKSIMMSLIGEANGGCGVLRTYCLNINQLTTCTAIDCGTFQQFIDLFRQAICIADDGLPAIRTITLQVDEQNPITPYLACASGVTFEEALNRLFVSTNEGVAVMIGCVNEAEG